MAAHQAPQSIGLPRQEYWSRLPFLSPRDLPNSGIEPASAGGFFSFIFISWRLITLQYCSVFVIHWHESAVDLHGGGFFTADHQGRASFPLIVLLLLWLNSNLGRGFNLTFVFHKNRRLIRYNPELPFDSQSHSPDIRTSISLCVRHFPRTLTNPFCSEL